MEEVKDPARKNNIRLTIIVVTAIAAATALICVIILLFFKFGNDKEDIDYTTKDIADQIISRMNYDNLSEITGDNISKYYEIPDGVVSDSTMYISTRTDNFTEFACFKLTSEDKEDTLRKVIEDYIDEKAATYQNINEKAYNAVHESQIFTHYPYVLISVSSDNNTVKSAFDSMFTDKVLSSAASGEA